MVRLPTTSGNGWLFSGKAAQSAVALLLHWRDVIVGLNKGLGDIVGPGAPGIIFTFEQ